eukprot:6214763-Pleurochrysis_carterae.AAC.2
MSDRYVIATCTCQGASSSTPKLHCPPPLARVAACVHSAGAAASAARASERAGCRSSQHHARTRAGTLASCAFLRGTARSTLYFSPPLHTNPRTVCKFDRPTQ